MIVFVMTKNVGNYYVNCNDLNEVITSIKNQLPIECWWYNDFGKKFVETMIFYDEEQVILVRSESDASPLEEM